MAYPVFEKETLLDISVNIIPILIILIFVGMLVFTEPWEFDLAMEFVALALHVVPIVSLAIVTYVAAKYIG